MAINATPTNDKGVSTALCDIPRLITNTWAHTAIHNDLVGATQWRTDRLKTATLTTVFAVVPGDDLAGVADA